MSGRGSLALSICGERKAGIPRLPFLSEADNRSAGEPLSFLVRKNLRGLSPRANYTDRATAACQRS
jgi:hypothetical protein